MGQHIKIRESGKSGKYNISAVIIEKRESGLSYLIKKDNGRILLRSIRHMRPDPKYKGQAEEGTENREQVVNQVKMATRCMLSKQPEQQLTSCLKKATERADKSSTETNSLTPKRGFSFKTDF